jgi:hypothetical protein
LANSLPTAAYHGGAGQECLPIGQSPGIAQTVGLPTAVYERACRIRAVHNYKLADALHLAAAIEGSSGLFLTNEHRLAGFPDITVEVLP